MRFALLALLASLAPSVFAYPQITYPAAGAQIPAGAITVRWTDDGTSPAISKLASYTMTLYVGGQLTTNSVPLVAIGSPPTKFTSSNSVTGTIDPALTATLANGFYIQMLATAKDGGTVTIYSDRFTLTGMTGGSEGAAIVRAVTALGGATAGPADINNVVAAAPVAPAAGAVTPAAGAAQYNIPYAQQQGTIKYAPMQGIPPNRISLKKVTPQFAASAWTVARQWLPNASIVTTVTEQQTFSVQSSTNTAAAQTLPTANDMQRFLNRWKD